MGEFYSVDDDDQGDWWDARPASKHRAGVGGFFSHTWPLFFFAGLCLVFALIGFFVPAKEGPLVGRTIGICCTIAAVGFLVGVPVRWAMLIKSVDVHDGGVVWDGHNRAGWNDIKDFYRTEIITNGAVTTRQVIIKTYDGEEAIFTYALGNWKKMADRIQHETTIRQVPEARQRYAAGETVKFGKRVGLDQDGMVLEGKRVDWDRIRGVRVQNGYLVVSVSGKGDAYQIPLFETPNVGVLLRLLEESPAGA